MKQRMPSLTIANDATIVGMIQSACKRVIYLAPGVSTVVSSALAERWHALGPDAVLVVVDVDPEVCRLGYGKIEALQGLERAASRVGGMVHMQPGVRCGLVIADDQTMFYAPTPLLVEAGSNGKADCGKPNAVRLGLPPADLERDLGLGPDGIAERIIGLDKAERKSIAAAAENLKANPPQQFDIARSVRIFNANFEFVELAVKGLAMDRKMIRIPSDLLGLDSEEASIKQALRMSMALVDQRHCGAVQRLHRLRKWISKKYLTPLTGYGNVIATKDKPKLITWVQRLEKYAYKLQKQVLKDLRRELDKKRVAIMNMALPLVLQNQPKRWGTRQLSSEEIKRELATELGRVFGVAEQLLSQIEVRLVFKGVTYEMLVDPEFVAMVRERLPAIEQLHEEHFAAVSSKPASHHETLFPEGAR